MDSTPFPKSPESSKLSGTSAHGETTGLGLDPVGDSASSRPMTGSADTGTPARSQSTGEAARSRFTSIAHDTVDKVAGLAGRYSGSPGKAMEASKTLVKEKPMLALGAAVALGLLLGRLTSR